MTEVPASTEPVPWERVELRELHESGLLWQINQATLWPLGLALTVRICKAETHHPPDCDPAPHEGGDYLELFVQKLEPFESIASGAQPEEATAQAERLEAWMRDRIGPARAPIRGDVS